MVMVDINDYTLRDFWAIAETSPILQDHGTTVFQQVYYPILVLEISMEEETFEDMEAVQYHIIEALLKLPMAGRNVPSQIAHAFGLSPQYVSKLLKLFRGYGYVDANYKITALGKEVHEKEKEIHRVHIKQLFHYDSLNSYLIRLSYNFDKRMIYKAKDVHKRAIIIPSYQKEEDKDVFCDYVTKLSGNDFIKHNKDILNVNIRSVDDAKCVDRKFIKGYLICNDEISVPLFYTKFFDLTARFDQRTIWKPLVVGSEEDKKKLQLGMTPLAKAPYVRMTKSVIRQLEEREEKRYERERRQKEEAQRLQEAEEEEEDFDFDDFDDEG